MSRNKKRKRKASEEGEDDFAVEVITHARFADASKQEEGWEYLVKWDGYDDDTWESAANLATCQRLLASFWGDVGNEDYKEGTVVAASETWIEQERKQFKIEVMMEMKGADKKARSRKRAAPPKQKPDMVISGPEDDVPLANLATSPKLKAKSPTSWSASRTKPESTAKVYGSANSSIIALKSQLQNLPAAELALAASPAGSSSDGIRVTARAQQSKAEFTGQHAFSPDPPRLPQESRLQSPALYSGPLPRSNTRVSQSAGPVHAQRFLPDNPHSSRVWQHGAGKLWRSPVTSTAATRRMANIAGSSSNIRRPQLRRVSHQLLRHRRSARDGPALDPLPGNLALKMPWCAGQKIISISEIVATDKGMLRCCLDWPAIVQQLGAGFAFEDYRCQHTPEELDKIFPPTFPKSSKSASVHERAQYLDHRGKEPCVASVRSPPGWFGDTQTDFSSLAQAIVHCDGEKLCLFWPATSQNLDWWGLPLVRHTSRLEEALGALEGLEVMHITEPCTFIVPPLCIHAVITFAGSTHTCVSFAHAAHWPMAKEGLEFCKRLLRNPIYPTCSAVELVRKFVDEASIWEQAIERDSAGTAYLAAWLVDMAPYTRSPQK
ncbi:hypothetical protein B0H14DRAFT_3124498 [Mycena olivaceomarginata]|nr:hypothetical protein B0H14DRAFT_3124498 [Mycena olivaceomarginata]